MMRPSTGRLGRASGSRGFWPSVAVLAALAFIAAPTAPAAAQQSTSITGTITEATTQRPLDAVQVFLVGQGMGGLTNQSGRYLILNVPAGTYTLRAVRIGYTAVDVQITVGTTTLTENIVLATEALGLDEIIVTGTAGAARRREIGNTVSQVNVTDVLESPQNVDALLQARVPGMMLMQNSASVGSGGQIRLRGNVSVSQSNQPIIYIDGVRVRSGQFAQNNTAAEGRSNRSNNDNLSPLNNISPADIERIEVIKGAAATTLYGTEASAGVIQIFTKRGHSGQARWTAQLDQGLAYTLPFGPDPSTRPPSEPAQTEAGGTSTYLFIDPWLRNAHQQRFALSVAGGGQGLQYFISGSIDDNEGVLPNDEEDKYIMRGNFTFSPMSTLQLTWNTSFTKSNYAYTAVGNNAHGLTLNAFRRDRNYSGSETRAAIDPLLNWDITTELDHLVSGVTATYSPYTNFTNRLTAGLDLAQQNNRNLRPFGFVRAGEGILNDERHRFSTLTMDYVGTVSHEVTDGIRNAFSFGGQAVTQEQESTGAFGRFFPGPGEPTVDDAGTTLGFEDRERVVNAGFFVQDVIDFHDKYFVTLGLRVDGNSAFGRDFGLQAYPKISGSYVVSDETFWPESLGEMKLRAAIGESGRAPGAFDAVRTYSAVGWGDDPAFFPSNVGNDEIGPERTREFEAGFDGSFVSNRLSLEFTFYHQTTKDALFDVRQIPSLGFLNAQLANVGEIKNSGIELSANATLIESESLSWDLGGTVFTNNSEVTSLGGNPDFSLGSFAWVMEGQPAPVIRADCVTNPDAIADPVIEQDCIYGPNLPTTILGVNTQLTLPAGLRLSARGEFQGGGYMYDGAAWNAVRRSVRWPGCFGAYTVQETDGQSAMTAFDRAQCLVSNSQADFFVYPAKFFKLREVTVAVPVPDRFLAGAEQATFTVAGRNIWKWVTKDFPVFEPETGANGGFDVNVRSILEHVPPPASWTASLRVVF